MPYPHSIRLRSPWELELIAVTTPPTVTPQGATQPRAAASALLPQSGAQAAQAARINVPGPWVAELPPQWHGSVQLRRRFHRPRTLERHERVFLVVEGAEPPGWVSVNGVQLGRVPPGAAPAEFEITPLLTDRNEVVLLVEAAEAGAKAAGRLAGWLGEVRLEIRAT